jgi:hypothetical protein
VDSSEATSASLNSLQRKEGLINGQTDTINGQGERCNLYPALVTTDKCEDSFLFPASLLVHVLQITSWFVFIKWFNLWFLSSIKKQVLRFHSLVFLVCHFSHTQFNVISLEQHVSAQCGHHQVQFPAFMSLHWGSYFLLSISKHNNKKERDDQESI